MVVVTYVLARNVLFRQAACYKSYSGHLAPFPSLYTQDTAVIPYTRKQVLPTIYAFGDADHIPGRFARSTIALTSR